MSSLTQFHKESGEQISQVEWLCRWHPKTPRRGAFTLNGARFGFRGVPDDEERRRDLDISSRILSELAEREAALDAQVAAAHEQAHREIEAAETEAARILREAQDRMKAMQAEHDQRLTAETVRIREEARNKAAEGTERAREHMAGRVQQAAEQVLRAVLP